MSLIDFGLKKFTYLGNILFIASTLLCLAACNPQYKVRYELTVNFEQDGKIYSASSIREDWMRDTRNGLPTEGGIAAGLRGEATAAKLPDGRVLVAILRGRRPGGLGADPSLDYWFGYEPLIKGYGLPTEEWRGGRNKVVERLESIPEGPPVSLESYQLPLLLLFSDPRDPSTASVFNPSAGLSNETKVIRFVSATVRKTSKEMYTENIEGAFPWLKDRLRSRLSLDGSNGNGMERAEGPVSSHIFAADFKAGPD